MIRGRRLLPVLLLLLAASNAGAAEPRFPPLTGRVVDQAEILTGANRDQIAAWLADFERRSRRQVVVATVKSLDGLPIEDYGYRLGRAWGIGEQGKDTGAILLVAPSEREVRIEVGYGLEGELTDAVSRAIIDSVILPAFRQGNYNAGVRAGTVAILRALGWTSAPANEPTVRTVRQDRDRNWESFLPFIFFIAFVLFRLFSGFGGGRRGPGILWGGSSRGRSFGGGGFRGGGGASGRW